VKRFGIIFAACALIAADLSANEHRSTFPEERERPTTPLSQWLPSASSRDDVDKTSPSKPEPAAARSAQPSRNQPTPTASQPTPKPAPKPQRPRTPEEKAADARWWEETGNPAVSAFSRCLAEHAADETRNGNQSSYPDLVTAAMRSRCSGEFGTMAQLILARHGENGFAKIARELIAKTFVPTVKQAVERGPSELIEPPHDAATIVDDASAIEVEMRQSKEAMFGCLVSEADRLAASSPAVAERVADMVIASCQNSAEAYFRTIEQLYPGTMAAEASEASAAILEASYRPAIVQRIEAVRSNGVHAVTPHPDGR
jgi:hypothetical protein